MSLLRCATTSKINKKHSPGRGSLICSIDKFVRWTILLSNKNKGHFAASEVTMFKTPEVAQNDG